MRVWSFGGFFFCAKWSTTSNNAGERSLTHASASAPIFSSAALPYIAAPLQLPLTHRSHPHPTLSASTAQIVLSFFRMASPMHPIDRRKEVTINNSRVTKDTLVTINGSSMRLHEFGRVLLLHSALYLLVTGQDGTVSHPSQRAELLASASLSDRTRKNCIHRGKTQLSFAIVSSLHPPSF